MFYLSYTLILFVFTIFAFLLDYVWLKTKLITQKRFWVLGLFVIALQTIFDNWLNGRWGMGGYVVGPYDPASYSGIKILFTPLENYIFGLVLVWMVISVFEYQRGLKYKFSPKT